MTLVDVLSSMNDWDAPCSDSGRPRLAMQQLKQYLRQDQAVVLKGVRRCGKSTLLKQCIAQLCHAGVDPKACLYVLLEDPALSNELNSGFLEQMLQSYRDHVYPDGKPFLFLDEVQAVPAWEKWVRKILEQKAAHVFITGSSAKLLSRELGTVLTGRHFSFEIFPLSFREFLDFKSYALPGKLQWSKQKNRIRNLLNQYLQFGGFPEVVLFDDPQKKERLLKQYFEDMMFRDIVKRHEIRDVHTLQRLAQYYQSNIARLSTYNKLKHAMGIPQDVVSTYTSYLSEAYLIAEVSKFSFKLAQQTYSARKIYSVDTGLRNAVSFRYSEDWGLLFENAVFGQLRVLASLGNGFEIYYAQEKQEVDFLIKQGTAITHLIQVFAGSVLLDDLKHRELQSLIHAMEIYPKTKAILITDDQEDIVKTKQGVIRIIPLWKWLLQGGSDF